MALPAVFDADLAPFDPKFLPRGHALLAAFEQGRFDGKPVAAAADPTCCSGSRATVCNGTGGKRLFFFKTSA
jgi:hypothetical protein